LILVRSSVDRPLTIHRSLLMSMALLLIPLDNALPAVQVYLSARGDKPLQPAEEQVAAQLLERCAKTGELLVAFALSVGGQPSRQ